MENGDHEAPALKTNSQSAVASWKPIDAVIIWIFFLILAYYKEPRVFVEGRFYAEEGQHFFANLCDKGFTDVFTYYFRGRLELFTNLASWLAGQAPFQLAPKVTTFFAVFGQSLPLLLIGYARRSLGISLAGCLLFAFLMVNMPQTSEVWLTTTSLHFYFCFLAAVILILPTPEDWNRHLYRVLIVACGLSGVTASFILPFFFIRAFLERDRERFIQAVILTATTLLQVTLILVYAAEHRPQEDQTFFGVFMSIILHQMLTPLLGIQAANRTSVLLKRLMRGFYTGIPFVLALLMTWGGAWIATLSSRRSALFYALAMDIFLLVTFCLMALVPMVTCLGAFRCTRYFFVPNCIFMLALVMGLHLAVRSGKIYLAGYISVMCAAIIWTLLPFKFGGPRWNEVVVQAWEARKVQSEGIITVPIWPPPWTMDLPVSCIDLPAVEDETEQSVPGETPDG